MIPFSASIKIGLTFLATSVVAAIVFSYVTAWHATIPFGKVLTRWDLFKHTLIQSIAIAGITTVLFLLPLRFLARLSNFRTSLGDYIAALLLAAVVQIAVVAGLRFGFASELMSRLLYLFVIPLIASGVFLVVRRSRPTI